MDLRGCDAWLALQLQDRKTHLCDDIKEKAKKRGFTRQELKDARKKIGVKMFQPVDENEPSENWFWYL